jgi:hypothetical protein
MRNGEKGQALVIVLAIVAFGGLVVGPFVGRAGDGLIGSRIYGEAISQQYSGDAGVEHTIWDLRYGDLAGQMSIPGDSVNYQLGETINGIIPDITVTLADNSTYEIVSVADGETIQAIVQIISGNVTVSQWQISS